MRRYQVLRIPASDQPALTGDAEAIRETEDPKTSRSKDKSEVCQVRANVDYHVLGESLTLIV